MLPTPEWDTGMGTREFLRRRFIPMSPFLCPHREFCNGLCAFLFLWLAGGTRRAGRPMFRAGDTKRRPCRHRETARHSRQNSVRLIHVRTFISVVCAFAPIVRPLASHPRAKAPNVLALAPFIGTNVPITGTNVPMGGTMVPFVLALAPFIRTNVPITRTNVPIAGTNVPMGGAIAPFVLALASPVRAFPPRGGTLAPHDQACVAANARSPLRRKPPPPHGCEAAAAR